MRFEDCHKLQITSGHLIVCDPCYVLPPREDGFPYCDVPPGVQATFFERFGGDGCFRVYQSGQLVVVETAPRLFARHRPRFAALSPEVWVDSGVIGFLDGTEEAMALMRARREGASVVARVEPGEYLSWREYKEGATGHRNCILVFGKSIQLLLHGSDANTVRDLEQKAAAVLQTKGSERGEGLAELRDAVLDLHISGTRDPRLRMLADAIGLDLPRRKGRRSEK